MPKVHTRRLAAILFADIVGYTRLMQKDEGTAKRTLLPKEILESRIAVVPYENKTNDESLDMLGDMAADWIVQALMNLGICAAEGVNLSSLSADFFSTLIRNLPPFL